MLVRHFDPDRREMMVVMLKVTQGTVPSAKAPCAEAVFSQLVCLFIFVELEWENKTNGVLKLRNHNENSLNLIILCDFLAPISSKTNHISGNTHCKTTLLSHFDIVAFQCLAANCFRVLLEANS